MIEAPGDRLVSHDPATGAVLGEVAATPLEEVGAVLARVRFAQPAWQERGYHGRAIALMRWRDAIRDDRDGLALLLSRENGKPLAEAMAEVLSACDFLAYYASHAHRFLKDQSVQVWNPLLRNPRTYVTFVPKGVVGVVSPWNYPLLLAMASVSGALAAGNTVVHKPSELTPLVAARVGELARKAGLPEGVFTVIPGDGRVGAALVAGDVNHVCFTGSVATGRKVAVACAERFVSTSLELGGKDPALVLPDADLDFTAKGLVWGAFLNAGQTCASVERVYVDEAIAEPLTERIVRLTRTLSVGAGQDPATDVGPIINEGQLAKIDEQVRDAVQKGAKLLLGGHRLERPGQFYAPTVLTDVTPDMLLMREETFGPVLPIVRVSGGSQELVRAANDSPFALSATVWGRDMARAEDVARQVEAGVVWINTGIASYGVPATQRGGMKESGVGRVGGQLGLLEYVESKLIDANPSGRERFYWYPSWPGATAFISSAIETLHGASVGDRLRGAMGLLRNWPPRR